MYICLKDSCLNKKRTKNRMKKSVILQNKNS